MTKREISIIRTLAYADIFDYPLKENEVWRYLIGKPSQLTPFRQTLGELVKSKRIQLESGYYVLAKRLGLVSQRQIRESVAPKKYIIAKRVSHLLEFIPTVYLVGISGALAMQNAPKDDDIDFFIICAPGTIWITRVLVTVFLDVLNLRRKPGQKKFKNKICLNMFMDGQKMRFPKSEQDIYTAHEIVQLKPLVDKQETYKRFLWQNRWLQEFLPQAVIIQKPQAILYSKNFWLISVIESLCGYLQLLYMRKRQTTEKITTHVLRFHPQDMRAVIQAKYKARVKQIKV